MDGKDILFISQVLILVLVEHTLGARLPVNRQFFVVGLNPCFSGTYSRSVGSSIVSLKNDKGSNSL